MNTNELELFKKKLDTIINLLAAQCVEGKSPKDGAMFLENLELDRKITATIYGTSQGSVRKYISEARKGSNKAHSSKKK